MTPPLTQYGDGFVCGCITILRHGGKRDVWPDGKCEEAIWRHTEIYDQLAQAIL